MIRSVGHLVTWDWVQEPLENPSKYGPKTRRGSHNVLQQTKKPRNMYWSTEKIFIALGDRPPSLRSARTRMWKQHSRHIKSVEISYSREWEIPQLTPARTASYISGWRSHLHKMSRFGILLNLRGADEYWLAWWTSKASFILTEMESLLSSAPIFKSRMYLTGYCGSIPIEIWTPNQ